MDSVIKALGMHSVRVMLHPEVDVTISANVARSEDEAETQAKMGRMVTAEEAREVAEAAEAEIEAVVAAVVEEEASEEESGEGEDSASEADTQAEGEEPVQQA